MNKQQKIIIEITVQFKVASLKLKKKPHLPPDNQLLKYPHQSSEGLSVIALFYGRSNLSLDEDGLLRNADLVCHHPLTPAEHCSCGLVLIIHITMPAQLLTWMNSIQQLSHDG